MKHQRICILGGTGFIGSAITAKLVAQGRRVVIPTRNPERHRSLAVLPTVSLVRTNIHDEESLVRLFGKCDAVINLVGILNESGDQSFRLNHVELPRKIAQACRTARVHRLLHMSSLKADAGNGPSLYLRSKGEGEAALRVHSANDVKFTIFQPSVIFGAGDSFVNRFAGLMRLIPLAFPLACPNARFQPVYVGDVADAFVAALDDTTTHGQRYTLCGPRTYTLREIVAYIREQAGLKRLVIGLPDILSRLQAATLQLVPGKPFSMDNYRSMQVDSVCEGESGLAKLGIRATPMELVVPRYLSDAGHRGQISTFRGG